MNQRGLLLNAVNRLGDQYRLVLLAAIWLTCGLCSFAAATYLAAALNLSHHILPPVYTGMILSFAVAGAYVSVAMARLPLPVVPDPNAADPRGHAERDWSDVLAFPDRATRHVFLGGTLATLLSLVWVLPYHPEPILVFHGVNAAWICIALEVVLLRPLLRTLVVPILHQQKSLHSNLSLHQHGLGERDVQTMMVSGVVIFGLVAVLLSVVFAMRWPGVGSLQLLILLGMIASIALAAWLYARLLLSPLVELIKGVRAIEAGELTWRAGVVGVGEIALLGEALDRALDHLQQTRVDLAETERLLAHAQRLETTGILTAGVMHELNNPTSAAQMNLLHAQRLTDDPELRGAIEDALAAILHIRAIANDFRLQARDRDEASTIDLDTTIDTALRMARPQLRNIRLEVDLRAMGIVTGSAQQLAQVLLNLVVNAAQALEGRPTPTIRIRSKEADGCVEVEVADNGPGLSPAIVSRVFDAFATTKANSNGTGLGLYVSRRIVETMGGTLQHRVHDGWTCFVMRVPTHEAPPDPDHNPESRGTPAPLDRRDRRPSGKALGFTK